MRSRTMNMSQGKPLKLLTLFAVPLLIGNLFQQAYNLADSFIVGQLVGAGALACLLRYVWWRRKSMGKA